MYVAPATGLPNQRRNPEESQHSGAIETITDLAFHHDSEAACHFATAPSVREVDVDVIERVESSDDHALDDSSVAQC